MDYVQGYNKYVKEKELKMISYYNFVIHILLSIFCYGLLLQTDVFKEDNINRKGHFVFFILSVLPFVNVITTIVTILTNIVKLITDRDSK